MSRAGGADPGSVRLYRWLVKLYPSSVRRGAEEEIVQIFRDAHADARASSGTLGVILLWIRTGIDIAASVAREPIARHRPEEHGVEPRMGGGPDGRGGSGGGIGELAHDLRHAARSLTHKPGFTTAAVLILALGIGANTIVFSIIDAVYLDPPPHVTEPDRLVRLYRSTEAGESGALAYPDYQDYRERNTVLAGLMAYDPSHVAVTIGVDQNSLPGRGQFVSYNYFDVLGVRPAEGRWFLPEEDREPGTHRVAVISHDLWLDALGGDTSAVGRDLVLNGNAFTVVGVAPEGFRGPSPIETPPDLWVPIHAQPVLAPLSSLLALRRIPDNVWVWLWSYGRLAEGVTVEAAQSQMTALAAGLEREYPEWNEGWGVRLYPDYRFHPPSGTSLSTMTRLLSAVVLTVLLIACANIAILLLARGTARVRDTAVRMALGAGRGRVVRSALIESLVLGLMGALVGVGLALALASTVAQWLPMTFAVAFTPDGTVMAFAAGLGILTALFFGMVPAVQAGRVDLVGSMKGRMQGRSGTRIQSLLVVAQVALTGALAVSAALLGRSLVTATSMPLGFEVEHRTAIRVELANNGYSREEGLALVDQALERIRALPGVRSASTLRMLPFGGQWSTTILPPDGIPDGQSGLALGLNSVSPDFFATMGIPLIAGRSFDRTDRADGPPVAVISESLARELWPGGNALGQSLLATDGEERARVVGIAADARFYELGSAPDRYAYLPLAQVYSAGVTFLVHEDPGASSAGAVRGALLELDPSLAVASIRTMADVLNGETARFRTATSLVGVFGGLALFLAMVGLYGVLSYGVARRRRDIALRVTLGATAGVVRRGVLGRALVLVGAGLVLGTSAALAAGRLLASFLYGVSPRDPLTLAAAPILLLLVAAAAALLPASRAASIQPMSVLRSD